MTPSAGDPISEWWSHECHTQKIECHPQTDVPSPTRAWQVLAEKMNRVREVRELLEEERAMVRAFQARQREVQASELHREREQSKQRVLALEAEVCGHPCQDTPRLPCRQAPPQCFRSR